MREPDCAFCKIATGGDGDVEILCAGATWVAFFPRNPATPGHTLVIPREHVTDLWALKEGLGGELINAVVRVGHAIQAAATPAGLNLISSAGEVAEQTVFHLHLHVVPRYAGDGLDPIWPAKRETPPRETEELARRIRQECARI